MHAPVPVAHGAGGIFPHHAAAEEVREDGDVRARVERRVLEEIDLVRREPVRHSVDARNDRAGPRRDVHLREQVGRLAKTEHVVVAERVVDDRRAGEGARDLLHRLGAAGVDPHGEVAELAEPLHEREPAAGETAGDHVEREAQRLELEAGALAVRDGGPPLRRAGVHVDRLVVDAKNRRAGVRAKLLPEHRVLHARSLQQHRRLRDRRRDDDALSSPGRRSPRRGFAFAGDGSAPRHRPRAAFEEDPRCGGAREDVPPELEGLGDERAVHAPLPIAPAPLEARAVAEAVP